MFEHNSHDTLWIPEQLVDIIVPNYILMVPFPSHKLSIDNFIALITDEWLERFCDHLKIQALWNRLHTVLAFRRPIIVVSAFEDEAERLWAKLHLCSFAPA